MTIGSPIKENDDKGDKKNYKNNYSNRSDNNNSEPKSYAFNGKVVVGIGIVMIISAITTISMAMYSQSPQIHLSINSVMPSLLASSLNSNSHKSQAAAIPSSSLSSALPVSSQKINKRIILIQQDFGWNGTSGGPPIIVDKGDLVQLVVINRGHMAHNLGMGILPNQILNLINKENNIPLDQRMTYIPYDMMAAMPCPGCQDVFKNGHINLFMEPGTQQVTTFVADKAGHFKYYCMVRGHLWLGMIGDLIVRESTGSTTNMNTSNTAL
jgi:uncharacterized cupredoxin-like copper-binding protein